MHPELLRAIVQARHEELIADSRLPWPAGAGHHARARRTPRVRRHAGALLIRAGARLVGERPAELELAHE